MSPIVPTVDGLVSHGSLYRREGCIRIIKTYEIIVFNVRVAVAGNSCSRVRLEMLLR